VIFAKAVSPRENAERNNKKGGKGEEDRNVIYGCCDDDVTRTYA
jgi:hypothetical protein